MSFRHSLWNLTKSSYQSGGAFTTPGLPYNPSGPTAAYKAVHGGMRAPREGLLHNMRRSFWEGLGLENHGGLVSNGTKNVHYSGSLFTPGGWREILHDVNKVPGSNMMALGARRSMKSSLMKLGGKALWPAMFAYDVSQNGLLTATKDAAISSAAFGAARWAAGTILPYAAPIAAVAGAIIGGRAALQAGREYNRTIRQVSFGNVNSDIYGTVATMRSASVNAIQSSKINGRSSLNFEASLLHR